MTATMEVKTRSQLKVEFSMENLHKYVELFERACSHYGFQPSKTGEYLLTENQKMRVNKFIRTNWR